MKRIALLATAALALVACARTDDVAGPSARGPSAHVVPAGDPDGAYSMDFTGGVGSSWLQLTIAQVWDVLTTSTQCQPNLGRHDDHSGDPTLAQALDDLQPASGTGFFLSGSRGGALAVTSACWFDEWNGGGFPESAWVRGMATVAWRHYAFAARLTSNGWPELTHLFQLDVAALYLDRNRNGLSEKDELFTVSGELHHADDTSLVQ